MDSKKPQSPVRVGVFSTVDAADNAVRGLQEAGFTKDQISVICSDKTKEAFFKDFEHEQPAGTKTPKTAATGGVIGAVVGGAIAATTLVATGGLSIFVIGPLFAGAGAAFGTFVGAMTSRGVEHQAANYYDQALRRGQLLVAAEVKDDSPESQVQLARADRAFEQAGAEPIPLPAG
jgi:hypothetical protein